MRIVYEVIERTIDKHGQFLLIPDIEVNTFWTNLGDSDDDIIDLYSTLFLVELRQKIRTIRCVLP